ncbi:hypothetical protein [Salinicoccus sp. CNSTN-B1]
MSRKSPDKSGVIFYARLIDMSLKEENNNYYKGYSYKIAETSNKGNISFYIGMIICRLFTEKKYNIKRVYHLKDVRLAVTSTTGQAPDYFGLKGNIAYLFECKGSSAERFKRDVIENAKNQLESVSKVILTSHKNKQTKTSCTSFKRQVFLTKFNNNDELVVEDIDPKENKGENKIELNITRSYIYYYNNIVEILMDNRNFNETHYGLDYTMVELEGFKIGLLSNFYEIIKHHLINHVNFQDLESNKYLYDNINNEELSKYEKNINNLEEVIEDLDNKYETDIQTFKEKVEKGKQNISVGLDGTLLII